MKKLLFCIFIFFVTFTIMNNININAQTLNTDDEKISFGSYKNYEEFQSKLNMTDKINVLVKLNDEYFHNSFSYLNELLLDFGDNYHYNSKYVPLFVVFFESKAKFVSNYENIINVLNQIDYDWALIDEYKEPIPEMSNLSDDLYYDWNTALNDVGLPLDDNHTINSSFKIGVLEFSGIPDMNNEYFKHSSINYHIYENKNVTDHATVITYILSEVIKNITDANIYISKFDDEKIIEILDWFVDNHVKVVNMSWGKDNDIVNLYCRYDAFFDFYSYYTGIIFVNSAGNTGDKVTPPGRSYNIITVGSVNKNLEVADESSYVSFNKKPTLVAPGCSLVNMYESIPYCNESNGIPVNDGTSFAAPFVTGIISLLMAEFHNISFTPQNMIAILIASSKKLNIEYSTYDDKSGYGLVNYWKAKEIIESNKFSTINLENDSYINEFDIDSHYAIELYITTTANCTRIDSDLDSYQQPTNVLMPSLKITILDSNGEKIYEHVTDDTITNTKITNFTFKNNKYKIVVEKNEETTDDFCFTVAFKNLGYYKLKSCNEFYHIYQSDTDIVQEKHSYEYNEDIAKCNVCYYSKLMDEIVISDPNAQTIAGSEVRINGGKYRGNTITQGFTRLLFFDGKVAPSISRLDYYWKTSNEEVAKVSEYGTVTALSVTSPCWVTITAVYKYDESIKLYKKLQILPDTRESSLFITYEVTVKAGGKCVFELDENAPTTFIGNYTFSVLCQEDEAPGVEISKWGTITAVAPGIMYITGYYNLNPNIVISIKVIVT